MMAILAVFPGAACFDRTVALANLRRESFGGLGISGLGEAARPTTKRGTKRAHDIEVY